MITKHSLVWLGAIALLLCATSSALASGQGFGPGAVELKLLGGKDQQDLGTGYIYNSADELRIVFYPAEGWRITAYHIDVGTGPDYFPPVNKSNNPRLGHFGFKEEFEFPFVNEADSRNPFRRAAVMDLEGDFDFRWGQPWEDQRLRGVAIHVDMVVLGGDGEIGQEEGAWAVPVQVLNAFGMVEDTLEIEPFTGDRWGWWLRYWLGHPKTGHFIDSPVAGLGVKTPSYDGVTDVDAKFYYFPGESVEIYLGSFLLGSTLADQKISPLDIFGFSEVSDPRVANMARLLQSLDVDGDPQGGIVITEAVVAAFEEAAGYFGFTRTDFDNDALVESVILRTIANAAQQDPPIALTMVSIDDAIAHLDRNVNNSMFRKRVSRTEGRESAKAKLNIATVWLPALRANGEPASFLNDEGVPEEGIPYYDESGTLIRIAEEAKPVVSVFTDADSLTGVHDVWAAVSRDDGATWKRKNISRMADRSSFEAEDGTVFYGACKKPVFQVKGNKILIAWTSKYARGGRPRYAIDTMDDYTYDDPYAVDDIYGVGGPQRSHNYVEDGYPEVGEVPYSAVWTCRGVIATQNDVNNGVGDFVGDIVWFKPERLTSARRDANQIFCAAASGAGFAIVWQEDPKGVRPGKAEGPGEGWSGATTNHKTDIWYSYVKWGDHTKIDEHFEEQGDPEHDMEDTNRPKALVPMSLPVRLTDNDVLNRRNMGLDDSNDAENIFYLPENLTRCVKFEGGLMITSADDPEAHLADYTVLRDPPEDHYMNMNCVNCHPPFGTEPHNDDAPVQAAPVPLVVLDAENLDFLGGFSNGDCVSCHYSHIVPRDRVIPMPQGLSELEKCEVCQDMGGVWKEDLEAYYPYEGYPFVVEDDAINDGTHRYGLEVAGLLSGDYYTFINNAGNERSVAITSDGRLLDGDTGASRPNVFLQPYTTDNGTTSAWAMITYEETKGAGDGPPEENGDQGAYGQYYTAEEGKNVIYHSFDFKTPDVVASGNVVNQPECETELVVDEFGNEVELPLLVDGCIVPKHVVNEEGEPILFATPTLGDDGHWVVDYMPQLAYENARRGRFLIQGTGAVRGTRTIMAIVYREGPEGHGRPADVKVQRWVIPEEDIDFTYFSDGSIKGVAEVRGNPYRFENIEGDWLVDEVSGQGYFANGVKNVSSMTPTEVTESTGDPNSDDPWGAVKVVRWSQSPANFGDLSRTNPYDDARAHRGQLRGDLLAVGFVHTDNWAAARNGNDKYDFYVRRSFDGGQTYTTRPDGAGTEHDRIWTYPSGTESPGLKVLETLSFGPGEFEEMRNLSQLQNNFESIIEPRLVATPGTIKASGVWTGIAEDKQDQNVFYVAWGTSTNPKKDPVTGEQDSPEPLDLYYSFTQDKGDSYYIEEWLVNPDSDGNNAGMIVNRIPWLAKGGQAQGEAQLRMTPDGTRFYSSWLDDGAVGSDIMFRRITSSRFEANNASAPREEVELSRQIWR